VLVWGMPQVNEGSYNGVGMIPEGVDANLRTDFRRWLRGALPKGAVLRLRCGQSARRVGKTPPFVQAHQARHRTRNI
jgi:hypothetical protein